MPLHQNQDGTWQWGKSGKKYKKKQDAVKQMKAIFANGYVEKHAALNGNAYNDINNKGSLYMTYKDVYNMIKRAAQPDSLSDKAGKEIQVAAKEPVAPLQRPKPSGIIIDPRRVVQPGDTWWKYWKQLGGPAYMSWPLYQQEAKYNNPELKKLEDIKPGMRVSIGTVD